MSWRMSPAHGKLEDKSICRGASAVKFEFVYDERLGIALPLLHVDWDSLTAPERAHLLLEWEHIRGRIPNRIQSLERIITEKQDRLHVEDDFAVSCALNSEIAELASCVTDLHLWFRAGQDLSARGHD